MIDYGPSLNTQDKASLFQPFFKTQDKLKEKSIRTGLGVSQQIAKSMNGSICFVDKDIGC